MYRKDIYAVGNAAEYMTHVRTYTGIETPQSGAEAKAPAAAVPGQSGRAAKYKADNENGKK